MKVQCPDCGEVFEIPDENKVDSILFGNWRKYHKCKKGPSKDEKGPKPWYEDIKDRFFFLSQRFNTLDKREVLLQKDVASLRERVEWLIKLREEREKTRTKKGVRDRFIAGLLVGLVISLIQIGLELWRMTY